MAADRNGLRRHQSAAVLNPCDPSSASPWRRIPGGKWDIACRTRKFAPGIDAPGGAEAPKHGESCNRGSPLRRWPGLSQSETCGREFGLRRPFNPKCFLVLSAFRREERAQTRSASTAGLSCACCAGGAAKVDMADADLSKNPYEVLGIGTGGPDVTDAEIKKARSPQTACVLLVQILCLKTFVWCFRPASQPLVR